MSGPESITIVESPFSAPTREGIVRNVSYAYLAARDCMVRNEAPLLSHLLYTQMLDDENPEDRAFGIDAGLLVGQIANRTALYVDLGVSRGMEYGIANAEKANRPVITRHLFDIACTAAEIDEAIRAECEASRLPSEDAVAAMYARILK